MRAHENMYINRIFIPLTAGFLFVPLQQGPFCTLITLILHAHKVFFMA